MSDAEKIKLSDHEDCLKYEEKHGKHQEILGLIVEGCRTKFGVANPLTVKCVMQRYGAIDEDWGLHCDEFKQFVDDYINNKTKTEEMKKNAIKQCNCNENLDERTGEDCLKYEEKHGKHQEILGLIVEGCRTKFGVANPLTVKCVMQRYGAIDEDWGLHCDEFKQFVDDYINNKTKTEEMKKNAIKQCNCNENLDERTGERERFGKTFVACWKSGLDKTCKDDAAIQGAPLHVEF